MARSLIEVPFGAAVLRRERQSQCEKPSFRSRSVREEVRPTAVERALIALVSKQN